MKRTARGLWLLFVFAVAAAAEPESHPVTMWHLEGETNGIWLLGSVHLLRPEDHPLPSVIRRAYREAETLVMEMDLDDIDPAEVQSLLVELGLIQDDRSLEDYMGAELYAEARSLAERADIPLAMLEKSEPWLAAVTVEQMMLARIGFDPQFGIESHMAALAADDDKEILGLETIRQQFEFLDNMSLESQRALLLQSLEEGIDIRQIMDELIRAWRYGDLRFLKDKMLDEIRDYPELYRTIVVERNENWLGQIEALMDDEEDYLVIVGALHLIGDDGLPALLSDRGHKIAQLHEPAARQAAH